VVSNLIAVLHLTGIIHFSAPRRIIIAIIRSTPHLRFSHGMRNAATKLFAKTSFASLLLTNRSHLAALNATSSTAHPNYRTIVALSFLEVTMKQPSFTFSYGEHTATHRTNKDKEGIILQTSKIYRSLVLISDSLFDLWMFMLVL